MLFSRLHVLLLTKVFYKHNHPDLTMEVCCSDTKALTQKRRLFIFFLTIV